MTAKKLLEKLAPSAAPKAVNGGDCGASTCSDSLDAYFLAKLESAEGPAHARNKAKCYYKMYFENGEPANVRFANKIKSTCQEAMATGDWKPVAEMLARFW